MRYDIYCFGVRRGARRGGQNGIRAVPYAFDNVVRIMPPVTAPYAHYVPAFLFEEAAGVYVAFKRRFVFRVKYLIHLNAEHISVFLLIVYGDRDPVGTAAEVGVHVVAEGTEFRRDLLLHGNGQFRMARRDAGGAEPSSRAFISARLPPDTARA